MHSVILVGKGQQQQCTQSCIKHLVCTECLLAAKVRFAKKEFTMPRLELISTHMAANLVDNIRGALKGYVVKSVYG